MTAPPGDIAGIRSELLERLDGIERELQHAHLHRQIYRELRDEIVAKHGDADATFLNSYSQVYARAQVMAIRRLADDDDETESLWMLIQRIRNNPGVASRTAVVDMVRERNGHEWADTANRDFTDHYGSGEHPEVSWLADRQETLRTELAKVLVFADRAVAHRDPRGPLHGVTFGEIHDALDHVTEIANELTALLRYSSVAYEHITIEGDWQACFRRGLFKFPPDIYLPPEPSGYV